MTTAPISKLEYLKKYMSSKNDEKKQKKKKMRQVLKAKSNVTIIDTDVDLKKIKTEAFDEEDEDAPQVVAIISDHDKELQTRKWRTVGSTVDRFTVKQEPPSPVSDHSEDQRADDADHSPVRRKRHDSGSDSDHSPIRRPQRNSDSDNSPPRKRKDSDSDASPKRKLDRDSDASPPRRNTRKGEDSDASPPRPIRSMVDEDGDLSPTRKTASAIIPLSKIKKEKMDKTLDGKTAGLQSAKDLRHESDALRQREDEAFKRLSSKVSGKTAETVHRDRATGKRRNLEAESEADRQKEERKQKMLEKFQEWGKGLKQSQAQEERLHQDIHEMSKPLARMAGDEDLESFLKAKDREGDPMAAYMAKKRKKQEISIPGRPSRPTYQGPDGPPNRFNIPPGYRWDGVDRSNGFEKQWFTKQTKKVAVAEEAYKWSVADM